MVINRFLAGFSSNNESLKCNCFDIFAYFVVFLISLFLLGILAGLGYALFFFDKTIIILGGILYVVIVIQIFLLAFPSYGYFFKTLFGGKCRTNDIVEKYIDYIKNMLEVMDKEQQEEKSESEEEEEEEDSNEKKEEKQKRIINDPLISELKNDNTNLNNKFSKTSITKLFFADDYFSLYEYSTSIAFDKHKQIRKRIVMLIFYILNLIVIFYDVYKLVQDYSDYLLASVIIRFLIIPFFSYYNIVTVLYHKAKDKTLKIVNYVSVIFTVINWFANFRTIQI